MAIDTAQKMLTKGSDPDFIADCTGLTLAEIVELAKSIK